MNNSYAIEVLEEKRIEVAGIDGVRWQQLHSAINKLSDYKDLEDMNKALREQNICLQKGLSSTDKVLVSNFMEYEGKQVDLILREVK